MRSPAKRMFISVFSDGATVDDAVGTGSFSVALAADGEFSVSGYSRSAILPLSRDDKINTIASVAAKTAQATQNETNKIFFGIYF
ncbi:hypothetical protein A3I34_03050 [Candidatus Jorgensenbacteria bacterium RIFCSPLOWO2_02_FULL_45_12]|uniref:Uncharacterized protein n=1 Tax=Candidatus Jorgensenbacteria bacterium RIFCSPHIGHO2_02_FULL_45_20 TaxID=1798470 RepID=A0A1F6BNA3_9BACT|nr:MAG: hypothetical protein A3D55_00890 [Candidatus Jorgensenbacteria bacterium RIFCSPHIGHO2_02_FULL_45_20]OGG42414.1 MAG: hypothetical protein A3I34_03050 [Candidatus Jorgensenbacteria bacterium RIFCSPLOWO2_02_FULL_45_12]